MYFYTNYVGLDQFLVKMLHYLINCCKIIQRDISQISGMSSNHRALSCKLWYLYSKLGSVCLIASPLTLTETCSRGSLRPSTGRGKPLPQTAASRHPPGSAAATAQLCCLRTTSFTSAATLSSPMRPILCVTSLPFFHGTWSRAGPGAPQAHPRGGMRCR